MQQYYYVLYPAILGGGGFALLRMFTMPLITRTPHELIIILRPNSYKVIKRVSNNLPYFMFKKGLYWFADPLPLGNNLVHVYFEGVNQPITHLARIDTKEADMLAQREYFNETKSHTVLLPVSMKVFTTNWALILNQIEEGHGDEKTISYKLQLLTNKEAGIKGRQQYRGGFFKRLGLYVSTQVAAEGEVGNASSEDLQSITVQTVVKRLGGVVRGTNFSSTYGAKILKGVKKLERDWYMLLTGALDMRIIIVLMVMVLAIVAVFLLFKPGDISSLPPPPPGVTLPPGSPLAGGT